MNTTYTDNQLLTTCYNPGIVNANYQPLIKTATPIGQNGDKPTGQNSDKHWSKWRQMRGKQSVVLFKNLVKTPIPV